MPTTLTEYRCDLCRRRYDNGERGSLCAEYGLTYGQVWKIGTRRSWKHLKEE